MQTGFIPISEDELRATNQHLVDLLTESRKRVDTLCFQLSLRENYIKQLEKQLDETATLAGLYQLRCADPLRGCHNVW